MKKAAAEVLFCRRFFILFLQMLKTSESSIGLASYEITL